MPLSGLGLDKCSYGAEVGSKAIYDFLNKYQPKLSLHGHIHESPEVTGRWYAKLGRTICIQPDQLDEFAYVTIDLSTMKLDRIKEQCPEPPSFHDLKLHLPDVEIVTLGVGERSSIVGRSLAHIELRRRYGVTLLAVRRGSQIFPNSGGDMRLCDDMCLLSLDNRKGLPGSWICCMIQTEEQVIMGSKIWQIRYMR